MNGSKGDSRPLPLLFHLIQEEVSRDILRCDMAQLWAPSFHVPNASPPPIQGLRSDKGKNTKEVNICTSRRWAKSEKILTFLHQRRGGSNLTGDQYLWSILGLESLWRTHCWLHRKAFELMMKIINYLTKGRFDSWTKLVHLTSCEITETPDLGLMSNHSNMISLDL